MYYIQLDEVNVKTKFSLQCNRHDMFRSFVFFFDAIFDLPNSWKFSTGPTSRPTHWMQTVACLPKEEMFKVWNSTLIEGTLTMERIPAVPRFWTVTIDYDVKWKNKPSVSRSKTFYIS